MANRIFDNVLVTAEIAYRLPDHPSILQLFIWQKDDLLPKLPKFQDFLQFWEKNLEGPIHSVRYTLHGLVSPLDFRCLRGEFRLN